ncbi:MAG: ATP-binding protein [Pyrinomonadaceae bacterium MAG19_C2-C3]|nr:ATP-binding protein [Pyrinomonadaceae bacterium MAG19_C2-C3]
MSLRTLFATLFALLALAILFYLITRAPQLALPVVALVTLVALSARLLPSRISLTGNETTHTAFATTDDNASSAGIGSSELPANALLEATMESMREGVLVVDASLRIVAANKAANDLFATQGAPLVAKRLTEITRNAAIHQAFQIALERGERHEVKVETGGADARGRRAFDVRVAPLRYNPDDAATRSGDNATMRAGAVGIFFDITRLERLERVRQEFLSNVSHELRTPLTAILTFVETLLSGAVDDRENNRRFLNVISRNAGRMHNLIDDILELSAIEAGTVRVERTPVRLRPLVSEVFTALAVPAEERCIALHNEVADSATVYADARRLEQMITNLADNAIKFNTKGGTVTVRYELSKDETRDRIIVTDSGEGISPEHINRIFERFYRVDRARSRALGGTGLGLAIVKHLARAHGGEASVASTSGNGAIFTIEFPKAAT